MRVCCGSCKTWYRATTGQALAPGERIVAQCPRCGSDMLLTGGLGDDVSSAGLASADLASADLASADLANEAATAAASPHVLAQPVVLEEDEQGGLEPLDQDDELEEGRAITERVSEAAFAAVAAADAALTAAAEEVPTESIDAGHRDTVPAPAPELAEGPTPVQGKAQGHGGRGGKKRKDKGRKQTAVAVAHDTAPIPAETALVSAPPVATDGEQALATPTERVDLPAVPEEDMPAVAVEPVEPDPAVAEAHEVPIAVVAVPPATEDEAWPEDETGAILSTGSITARTPSPFASTASADVAPPPAAAEAKAPAAESPAATVSPVVAAAAASSALPVATPKVFTHPRILPVPVGPKPRGAPAGRTGDGRTGSRSGPIAKNSSGNAKLWSGLGLVAALALGAVVALSNSKPSTPAAAPAETPAAQGEPAAPESRAAVAAPAPAAPATVAPAPASPAEPKPSAEPAAPAVPAAAAEAQAPAAKPAETKPGAEAQAGAEPKPSAEPKVAAELKAGDDSKSGADAKPHESKGAKAESGGKKATAAGETAPPDTPAKAAGPAPEPAPAGPAGLDSDAIEEGLVRIKPGVRMCARAEERRNPEAALTSVTLSITVAPSGDVTAVTMTGVVATSELGKCIRAAVDRVTFPHFDGKPQSIKKTFDLAK